MNENRLPDYLQHMRLAAADAVDLLRAWTGLISWPTSERSRRSS